MNNNFKFSKDKKIIFFKENFDDFFIAFTTRKIKNKTVAEKTLGIKKINILKQIHSDKIIIVKRYKSLHNIKADGIITDVKNYAVAVKVADCIGTIIIDLENKVVGTIHSGWRGVAKKIILKTVKIMKKHFGSKPDKLIAITSPSIGPCCYNIGDDLYKKFNKEKIFNNVFIKNGSEIFMDLQKANKNLLLKSGVDEKNIYINKLCTKCNNDLFFSYRKEGKKAGRMFAVGMIK